MLELKNELVLDVVELETVHDARGCEFARDRSKCDDARIPADDTVEEVTAGHRLGVELDPVSPDTHAHASVEA